MDTVTSLASALLGISIHAQILPPEPSLIASSCGNLEYSAQYWENLASFHFGQYGLYKSTSPDRAAHHYFAGLTAQDNAFSFRYEMALHECPT